MTHMRIECEGLPSEFLQILDDWQSKAAEALVRLQEKRCRGSEFTGWYNWPKLAGFSCAKQIRSFVDSYPLAYDTVVVVGIGGSYAGCRAVDQALKHNYQELLASSSLVNSGTIPLVYAGHNLSEKQLIELLDVLNSRQIVLTVISKSGTTTETSVAFRILRHYMEQHYGVEEARQRTVVITDAEHGCLRHLAEHDNLKSFVLPADVGGRFSVFTPVGLVPLALAGHDIDSLLQGADELFSSLEDVRDGNHPVLLLSAIRRCAWELGKRVDILSYSNPQLAGLIEWWKQLFGESEGKEGKGMLPVGMAYSTDLHSLGQYVQEGFLSMLQTFLFFRSEDGGHGTTVERRMRVPKVSLLQDGITYLEGRYIEELSDGAMLAAYQAHSARGVPCVKIEFPPLQANTLGYMIAAFQVVCGISADLLDVNPYDQPGVEAYKKRMFALFGRPGY